MATGPKTSTTRYNIFGLVARANGTRVNGDPTVSISAVQCSGRSQPLGSGYRDRVISAPAGGEGSLSLLGLTVNQSVCNEPQCEASPILFPCPGSQAVFEDAFRHPWDNLDVYAFPPFPLVERVVARVRETPNLSMTVVAPLWPGKEWFADLLLLTHPPVALPWWDWFLCQPHFHRFHNGIHVLNLHSWQLSSLSSESWAFREDLLLRCPATSGPPLPGCTRPSGCSFVVGVLEGVLLQSAPLYH